MEERLQLRRAGEAIRNRECARVTKSGKELEAMMTLSLLTDERGEPEAISMISWHVKV